MVRKVMEPEERKSEILDVAEELFSTKGFDDTTTGDILEKAGIARGTLYYYFKSKEEIMNAVIERTIDRQVQSLKPILEDNTLNALEKIKLFICNNRKKNNDSGKTLDYLHKPENIVMHQKSLVAVVQKFAPLIAEIIQQGIAEKRFQTEYPLELVEFILVGMSFLFDTAIFPQSQEKKDARTRVLIDIMETSLRVEKGSFDFLIED